MRSSKAFMAAGLIGVGIGLLLAPRKGTDTRQSIFETINDIAEELKDFKTRVAGIGDKVKSKMVDATSLVEEKAGKVKDGVDDLKSTVDHIKTIFS